MELIIILHFCLLYDIINGAVHQVPLAQSSSRMIELHRRGEYAQFLHEYESSKSNGSQTITDWYDTTYTMRIWMGTPQRYFDVALESTSATLWIVGVSCTNTACSGPSGYTIKKYNQTASSTSSQFASSLTWLPPGSSYNMRGSGCLDNLNIAALNVTAQPFVSVDQFGDFFFSKIPADGVIGFGWPSLGFDGRLTPVMQMLLPQLDQPIFTVWFDSYSHVGAEGTPYGGLITFGAIDSTNCDTPVNYVPLSTTRLWQFGIDRVSLGNYSQNDYIQAMVALDYSIIGGPQAYVDSMMQTIGARYNQSYQQYQLNCGQISSLPPLRFIINGQPYSLTADSYVRKVDLGDGNCSVDINAFASTGFGPRWALGQTFLRVYCVTHDFGNERIGFARMTKNGRNGDQISE